MEKALSIIILLALALGALVACGGDTQSKLVGTWENKEENVSLTFYGDGKGVITTNGYELGFTWFVKDKKLSATDEHGGVIFDEAEYTVSDTTLKVEQENDPPLFFKKLK